MQILTIRWKNLNSLVGEWIIDFTDSAYEHCPIFALTGPTGAGKSTILDAICLGLYGRTPRLGVISKKDNHILSRHYAECFAEVTFAVHDIHYRVHWSQRRAYGRGDGELQAPKHELSEVSSGYILAEKLTTVSRKIEEITGLDFERFTRSVLLAQGSFALFLQANADERSPILEKITGTKIYSDISQKVYERTKEELLMLDRLSTAHQEIELLSDDEENTLIERKESLENTVLMMKEKLGIYRYDLQLFQEIEHLRQDLMDLENKKCQIIAQKEVFAPQKVRLTAALRALEVESSYQQLQSLRNDDERDRGRLGEIAVLIENYTDRLVQQELTVEQLSGDFDQQVYEYEQKTQLFTQVRKLDTELAMLTTLVVKDQTLIQDNLQEIQTKNNSIADLNTELSSLGIQLHEINSYIDAQVNGDNLIEDCVQLDKIFSYCGKLRTQIDEHEISYQDSVRTAQQHSSEYDVIRDKYDSVDSERVVLVGKLSLSCAQLESLLKGKTIADHAAQQKAYEKALGTIEYLRVTLDKIIAAKNQYDLLGGSIADLRIHYDEQQDIIAHSDSEEMRLSALCAHIEQEIHECESMQILVKYRDKLQKQEPCLLCGSMYHPYVNDSHKDDTDYLLNEKKELLRIVIADSRSIQERKVAAQILGAQKSKEIEFLTNQRNIIAKEIENYSQSADVLCSELSVNSCDFTQAFAYSDFYDLLSQRQDEYQHNSEEFVMITQLSELIRTHEQDLGQLHEKLVELQSIATRKAVEKNTADNAVYASATLLGKEKSQLQTVQEEVQTLLVSYGFGDNDTDYRQALSELVEQKDRYSHYCITKTEYELRVSSLEYDLRTQNQILEHLQQVYEKNCAESTQREGVLASLTLLREELFGTQDPDIVHKDYLTRLDNLREQRDSGKKLLYKLRTDLEHYHDNQKTLNDNIEMRVPIITAESDEFINALQAHGFITENDFLLAKISEEERVVLYEQLRKIEQSQLINDTALAEKKLLLEQCISRVSKSDFCSKALSDMQSVIEMLEDELRKIVEEITACSLKLVQNRQMKEKYSRYEQDMSIQGKSVQRWVNLNKLIGSYDGKLYRNFAQGITFELMIASANRELQKMTDRYLLVHDHNKLLELNVIDLYQANAVRTTKNLSGGEVFIVSLALALGLSVMASNNIRVDSLFLDEGFGTLDDQTLEIALDTLANLHHQGKKIGVISHISAVKDRIYTHIEVIPLQGGKSIIRGPGCSSR